MPRVFNPFSDPIKKQKKSQNIIMLKLQVLLSTYLMGKISDQAATVSVLLEMWLVVKNFSMLLVAQVVMYLRLTLNLHLM
jgi:hypothetical protein